MKVAVKPAHCWLFTIKIWNTCKYENNAINNEVKDINCPFISIKIRISEIVEHKVIWASKYKPNSMYTQSRPPKVNDSVELTQCTPPWDKWFSRDNLFYSKGVT